MTFALRGAVQDLTFALEGVLFPACWQRVSRQAR